MEKIKEIFFIVILLASYFLSSVFAEDQNLQRKPEISVDFRLVCEKPSPNCDKFVSENSKEELFLEKNNQLSVEDIDFATAVVEKIPGFEQKQDNRKSLILKEKTTQFEPPAGILLKFTEQGKEKLVKLTSENIRKRLAIVINGQLIMAPRILEPITEGEIKIVGADITTKYAQELAFRINLLSQFRKKQIEETK